MVTFSTPLGIFVIARLLFCRSSQVCHAAFPYLLPLSVLSALYAAVVGLGQHDLRRALGYFWMSQQGFLLAGLSSLTVEGISGALLHSMGTVIVRSGLALIAAAVVARAGTSDVRFLGGFAACAPLMATSFLLLSIACHRSARNRRLCLRRPDRARPAARAPGSRRDAAYHHRPSTASCCFSSLRASFSPARARCRRARQPRLPRVPAARALVSLALLVCFARWFRLGPCPVGAQRGGSRAAQHDQPPPGSRPQHRHCRPGGAIAAAGLEGSLCHPSHRMPLSCLRCARRASGHRSADRPRSYATSRRLHRRRPVRAGAAADLRSPLSAGGRAQSASPAWGSAGLSGGRLSAGCPRRPAGRAARLSRCLSPPSRPAVRWQRRARQRKTLQCRYHGWTYAPDGRLLHTPGLRSPDEPAGADRPADGFRRDDFSLIPVEVATFGPLIFVRLQRRRGRPTLPIISASFPPRSPTSPPPPCSSASDAQYRVACNWKVYVDNYLEGYHIPMVHPALMRELDYPAYRVEPRPSTRASTPRSALSDSPAAIPGARAREYSPAKATVQLPTTGFSPT